MAAVGRPRSFDVDRALDAALEVFWRHSYEGASISDLTEAMGINRPALYSAFGSKQDLFLRALNRYFEVDGKHTSESLAEPTARRVIEEFLFRSVAQLTDPDRPMGCFVLQSALVSSTQNHEIAEHMAAVRASGLADLAKRFEQAQQDGDLDPGEDPAALSRYVWVIRHGLAVLACGGADRGELEESVRRALAYLPSTAR
jgi:AcrR family transcriptional regulator